MLLILQLGKAYGVESFVLSPEETKKLYPHMNVSDIYGSLYSPQDGTIDPAGYCTALTRGAKNRGAKVTNKQTYSFFICCNFWRCNIWPV